MEYIIKLSFKNQETWEKVKESLATVKDENTTYPWYGEPVEGIKIYTPATYDEDGNILTEASTNSDYPVDVFSKVKIPELNEYLIEAKTNYAHMPNGGNFEIINKLNI